MQRKISDLWSDFSHSLFPFSFQHLREKVIRFMSKTNQMTTSLLLNCYVPSRNNHLAIRVFKYLNINPSNNNQTSLSHWINTASSQPNTPDRFPVVWSESGPVSGGKVGASVRIQFPSSSGSCLQKHMLSSKEQLIFSSS